MSPVEMMADAATQGRQRGAWEAKMLEGPSPEDLQQVSAFLQSFTPAGADPAWSAESLAWKLGESNPAGRGWLACAVADHRIIGVATMTRKRLWYQQRVVAGAEVGDTYTHRDFLRRSTTQADASAAENAHAAYLKRSVFGRLVTELRQQAIAEGIRVIYGIPNASSKAGYEKRLGFVSHPSTPRLWVRPTPRGLAQRYRGPAPMWSLIGALERLVNCGTSVAATALRTVRGYRLERCSQPSEAFDALWHRVKSQYAFSLVRDQAYFRHRFVAHPLASCELFTLSHRQQLHGVMATRVMTNFAGKRYCGIAEWLVDESRPECFPLLLAHAICRQDSRAIDGFALWGGATRRERAVLSCVGFVPVSVVPVIFFHNDETAAIRAGCPRLSLLLAASDHV